MKFATGGGPCADESCTATRARAECRRDHAGGDRGERGDGGDGGDGGDDDSDVGGGDGAGKELSLSRPRVEPPLPLPPVQFTTGPFLVPEPSVYKTTVPSAVRIAAGLWLHAGTATFCRTKGPAGVVETAATTWEFVPQFPRSQ